ncbi:hypothetical protein F511_43881 [Dorcoceras hygrometricum]|uniref:Uncharacterized protein n=1 Tax=Dorcoceras hygrometricum TaxID=472368 RepID=A0A2Z7BUY1_9LAMI|nr:hypothetical protein F511_43881 [Dorcoceras hygrometricum]
MTSALMSSQSAEEVERKLKRRRVNYQQMKREVKEKRRRRGGNSAGCNCSSAGCYLRWFLHRWIQQECKAKIQQMLLQNDVVQISWNDSVLHSRRNQQMECVDENDQQDDLCEESADALQI